MLFRKYLKVGLNTVARAIQHKSISSCLLAGDVSEDFLISHLVTMAGIRGIAVLIVPKLKDSISNVLGFSSTALGVTVCFFNYFYYKLMHINFQWV